MLGYCCRNVDQKPLLSNTSSVVGRARKRILPENKILENRATHFFSKPIKVKDIAISLLSNGELKCNQRGQSISEQKCPYHVNNIRLAEL